MAKELPYFKFEPAEYLTGDISFCSLSAQGFFIVICSYYWQRNCELTKTQLLKRLNKVDEFNELVSENIILLEDETIKIKFLDEQLDEVKKTSKTNSENGKKGGRPRKIKPEVNPQETENKPTALISLSETKGIREDKIREDKRREDKIRLDEIRKENKINNNNYAKICFKDDAWLEAIAMKCNVRIDVVKLYLENFVIHLVAMGEDKTNIKEFKIHYVNWIQKQDLSQHKTKRVGRSNQIG